MELENLNKIVMSRVECKVKSELWKLVWCVRDCFGDLPRRYSTISHQVHRETQRTALYLYDIENENERLSGRQ